jgi:hypothetical protein
MDGIKKDASAVVRQDASVPQIISTNSIPQNTLVNQGQASSNGNSKKKSKKGERHMLGYNASTYSAAFKFYNEQLPQGESALIQAIQKSDKRKVQILAIKHYRDTVTDGIWAVAAVKPHWHVIVRMTNRKDRMTVCTILKDLHIKYRKGVDDELWMNHGVETTGNFPGYAMYLTHETKDAIRDAKERYDVSEIISNLTPEEVEQIRDGYIRVSEKRKLTQDELVALDKEAYDMGYSMKNFDSWYNDQPFVVRSNAKMKVIKESYDRGVKARVDEHQEINRLCIFIQGDPNTGKTYAAKKALDGKRILPVGGGGTGKFDLLRPDHDAIVVDDDVCPNLLNMTDNYICRAYKRNSNNPAWAGCYFVVTSNLSFGEWLERCGIHTRERDDFGMVHCSSPMTAHFKAMKTRFFICRLKADENGVNHLALTSPSSRGSSQDQLERLNKFLEFKHKFDDTIASYVANSNYVDYSSFIEPLDE